MLPTLTAPGSKRLKLEHEKLLSNFAFNFKLRRYIVHRPTVCFVVFELVLSVYSLPLPQPPPPQSPPPRSPPPMSSPPPPPSLNISNAMSPQRLASDSCMQGLTHVPSGA